MKLNIQERLTVLSMMPTEGSFMELLFSKQITDSVKITAEETDKYNIKYNTLEGNTSITWSPEAMTEEVDCYLAIEHIKLLKDLFDRLDADKKLTIHNFSTAMKVFEKVKELNL